MNLTAAALLFAVLQAQGAAADVTLELAHPLRSGEIVWVEVHVGVIARGQEIDVTTASGRELGVISPYGKHATQDAGIYSLPLPLDLIRDGHVSLRLSVTQPGAPPRAPTARQVRSVKLRVAASTSSAAYLQIFSTAVAPAAATLPISKERS